jgi:hypothetical protein
MQTAERRCPACNAPVKFNELVPINVKRKPPLPPVSIKVCQQCFDTTAQVLRLIEPYYPQALEFVLPEK